MLFQLISILIFFASLIHLIFCDDDVIDLSHLSSKLFGKPIENSGKIENNFDENFEELGPYLEGDLLIPSDARNGMKTESLRWKNGEIPFEIRGSFSKLGFNKKKLRVEKYFFYFFSRSQHGLNRASFHSISKKYLH
jgi:hypothetical protein